MLKKSRRKSLKKTRRKRRSRHAFAKRSRGGGDVAETVPKVCIQTAKQPIEEYITTQLKTKLQGWDYMFFSDEDIIRFFDENPHTDYPDIKTKFNSFVHGEHKADLFRYYYIFLKGGVFIDSDLMLYDSIDTIIGNKKFVSVRAIRPTGSVYNGFLAATPQHPILLDALNDAYKVNTATLAKMYHLLVVKLGSFVDNHMDDSVKLLKEVSNNDLSCNIEDPDSGKISMIHYQNSKIPEVPPGNVA
jgi:mannosyltransferase OCH1-like enzyme